MTLAEMAIERRAYIEGIAKGAERERRRIRRALKPVLKRMRKMFPDDSYIEGELMIEAIDDATRSKAGSK